MNKDDMTRLEELEGFLDQMLDAADTLETLGRSWAVQIESMAGEYAAQIRRRAQTLKPGAGVEFIE